MRLALDDVGVRQGVTAVERMRTYGGRVFVAKRHMERFERTTKSLMIDGLPSTGELMKTIDQLLVRNEAFLNQTEDVGVTIVATPGRPNCGASIAVHLTQIDHQRVRNQRQNGQPIVVTDVVSPPNESWSRNIKVRSRIHYYRADRIASAAIPGAIGVLVDEDGTILETSTSNLAIVVDGDIISPPEDRVLNGVTQAVIEDLAADLSFCWQKQPVTADALRDADEVLLMGTTAGLWYAHTVDTRNTTPPNNDDQSNRCSTKLPAGPVYSQLLAKFESFCTSFDS